MKNKSVSDEAKMVQGSASEESNQEIHLHKYDSTNKWGTWITDPKRPEGHRRLYIGAYDTKYLAMRAQDRAYLKFSPGNSGKLNFKASDYDLDQELRDTLSCKAFRKLLMGESRSSYKKWDPSPCWKKFLDEEARKGNLPEEARNSYFRHKPVKSLATALQELTQPAATASKAKVTPVARMKPHRQGKPTRTFGQDSIAETSNRTTRSAAHHHACSKPSPPTNRLPSNDRIPVAAPKNVLQVPKLNIRITIQQAPEVLHQTARPIQQAPKVDQPSELPVRKAPKLQAPKVEAPKVEAPKVEAPKVEARKVLQETTRPNQHPPKVDQPSELPVRIARTKVRHPKERAIRQVPLVQELNELAILQKQPARECSTSLKQSENYPLKLQSLNIPSPSTPLDRLEWKKTGKRSSGTKRIIQPATKTENIIPTTETENIIPATETEEITEEIIPPATETKSIIPATEEPAAAKPCNKKKLLDLNREQDEGNDHKVKKAAKTLILLKAGIWIA